MSNRLRSLAGASTRVVPGFSVGRKAYVGAYQVAGPPAQVAKVRAVFEITGQLEGGKGRFAHEAQEDEPVRKLLEAFTRERRSEYVATQPLQSHPITRPRRLPRVEVEPVAGPLDGWIFLVLRRSEGRRQVSQAT